MISFSINLLSNHISRWTCATIKLILAFSPNVNPSPVNINLFLASLTLSKRLNQRHPECFIRVRREARVLNAAVTASIQGTFLVVEAVNVHGDIDASLWKTLNLKAYITKKIGKKAVSLPVVGWGFLEK